MEVTFSLQAQRFEYGSGGKPIEAISVFWYNVFPDNTLFFSAHRPARGKDSSVRIKQSEPEGAGM